MMATATGLGNVAYSYQWLAANAEIAGAISSSYTLAEADEGKTVKVRVSFTDDAGNEETLTSAGTAAVEARPNSPATGALTISGTVQVGETLTADTSGIADEDGLDDSLAVSSNSGQALGDVDFDLVPGPAHPESVLCLIDHVRHVSGFGSNREHPRLDPSNVEEVVDQVAHAVCLLINDAEELTNLGGVEGGRCTQKSSCRPLDGGQWRPQLVAHHAEEFGAQPPQLFKRRHVLDSGDDRHDLTLFREYRRGVYDRGHRLAVRKLDDELIRPHGLPAPSGAPRALPRARPDA